MAQRLIVFDLSKPAPSLVDQGAYFDKAILGMNAIRLTPF
jgi:hypothetical protein